jgi:ArsR family transcriptional regulator, arsenate/arsenite/antimonite-responsive transcriptional repressor
MRSARQFQALAHPTRLRLLALLHAGPLCVCHLQRLVAAPQAEISKHLAVLRARALVTARREGQWVIYSLAKPAPPALAGLADLCAEEPRLRRDREKLSKLDLSCSPAVSGSDAAR